MSATIHDMSGPHTRTMNRHICLTLVLCLAAMAAAAQKPARTDSLDTQKAHAIDRVVVTGTRNSTDIRHLPMTVTTIDRASIDRAMQPSLLPLLTEQIPGLFVTARGVMGYGVSGGAAGAMSLRGLSGGSGRMMVLIDGHPQYMGLMGHPIADAYRSAAAERVEVLRGPASVLYGSNAMGGVVNIVTRQMEGDGIRTDIEIGYGSYNTLQTEATNRLRKGRFSSTVDISYDRTDGHRADMGFDQTGGFVKLGYDMSPAWDIRADADINHFNASQPGSISEPLLDADQSITRGMASLAVENDYGTTSGAVSLFYNWGRHRINDGHAADEAPLDYRFNSRDMMTGASIYQSVQLFAGNRLTAGADYYRFGGRAWNRHVEGDNAGQDSQIADNSAHEVAGYIDFRQHIGHAVTFDAGLRVDHHSHIIDGTDMIVTVPRQGATPLNMNTGKIDNAGVEVEAAYRIGASWQASANYSFLHMENPVVAAPEHKLYAEGLYFHGRWNISSGIQYVAGLYTAVPTNGSGEYITENFVLWNLRAAFRAARHVSVWVRGENLLARRYEINAGYPMPRATVMAGVKFDF